MITMIMIIDNNNKAEPGEPTDNAPDRPDDNSDDSDETNWPVDDVPVDYHDLFEDSEPDYM